MKQTKNWSNKTKTWFFEKKINKIDKPLAKLTNKKRKKTQTVKIRNKRGDIMTDSTEIKKIMRILWVIVHPQIR